MHNLFIAPSPTRPMVVSAPANTACVASHSTLSQADRVAPLSVPRPMPLWACGGCLPRLGLLERPFYRLDAAQPYQPSMQQVAPLSASKGGIKRDFKAYPAILNLPKHTGRLWAISDIHGDYDRFTRLAASHGLLTLKSANEVHWTGKTDTLVVIGDLIDKGPKNLEVLDLMQQLEAEAQHQGGRIVNVLGNHEAEFLADPLNDKAKGPGGIFWDLKERNLDSKVFASDAHPTGAWLRRMPLGARVGDWFFAHGGQTSGRSLEGLDAMLETALRANGFNDLLIRGPNSITRGRNWYGRDGSRGQLAAQLLGVQHIAFGHDPDSISPRGKIVAFPENAKQLVRLDTGMSVGVNYSHGEMLMVAASQGVQPMHACGPDGAKRSLGTSKPIKQA